MVHIGSELFLLLIMAIACFNVSGSLSKLNLRFDSNDEVDEISNYFENEAAGETLPLVNEINYQNRKVLTQPFPDASEENDESANKFGEVDAMKKLISAAPISYKGLDRRSNSDHSVPKTDLSVDSKKMMNSDRLRKSAFTGNFAQGLNTRHFTTDELESANILNRNRKRQIPMYSASQNQINPSSHVNSFLNPSSSYPHIPMTSLQNLQASTPKLNMGMSSDANDDITKSLNQVKDLQNMLMAIQSPQSASNTQKLVDSAKTPRMTDITNPPGSNVNSANSTSDLCASPPGTNVSLQQPGVNSGQISTPNVEDIANVLKNVLTELENLKKTKDTDSPEGSPCDIAGSWNSEVIGLKFEITAVDPKLPRSINIEVQERFPGKRHAWIDVDWVCNGGAINTIGGPFHIVAEKAEENTIATFVGFCKVCGGMDMIFGTWSIVHPAKDCQDLYVAFDTKKDVFRRNLLPQRKMERYEQIRKKQSCGRKKFNIANSALT